MAVALGITVNLSQKTQDTRRKAAGDGKVNVVIMADGYDTEKDLTDYFDPLSEIVKKSILLVEPFRTRQSQINFIIVRETGDKQCDCSSYCGSDRASVESKIGQVAGQQTPMAVILRHQKNDYGARSCATNTYGQIIAEDGFKRGFKGNEEFQDMYKNFLPENDYGNHLHENIIKELVNAWSSIISERYQDRDEFSVDAAVNCCKYSDPEKCPNWAGIVGTESVTKICNNKDYFRASENSILGGSTVAHYFNSVAIGEINRQLDRISGGFSSSPLTVKLNSYGDIGTNGVVLLPFSMSDDDRAKVHHFNVYVDGKLRKNYYYNSTGWGSENNYYFKQIPEMYVDTRNYPDGNHKIKISAIDGLNRDIGNFEREINVKNNYIGGPMTKPAMTMKSTQRKWSVYNKGMDGMVVMGDKFAIVSFDDLVNGGNEETILRFLGDKINNGANDFTKIMEKRFLNVKLSKYGKDGTEIPVISYLDDDTTSLNLKYIECKNDSCTDKVEYGSDGVGSASGNNSHSYREFDTTSDKDGNKVTAMEFWRYTDKKTSMCDIKIVWCKGKICDVSKTIPVVVDGSDTNVFDGSLKILINSKNNPVLIYGTRNRMEQLTCESQYCETYKIETFGDGRILDAALDVAGRPMILYSNEGAFLKLVKCKSALCQKSDFDNEIVVDGNDWINDFYRGALAIDKNNNPVVLFGKYDGLWLWKDYFVSSVYRNDYNLFINSRISLGIDNENKPLAYFSIGDNWEGVMDSILIHCDNEYCLDQIPEKNCRRCELDVSGYTGPNRLGADYDCDKVVNGADYVVWRSEFIDKMIKGIVYSDGNCDGKSSVSDYSQWRELYMK